MSLSLSVGVVVEARERAAVVEVVHMFKFGFLGLVHKPSRVHRPSRSVAVDPTRRRATELRRASGLCALRMEVWVVWEAGSGAAGAARWILVERRDLVQAELL